MTYKPNREVFRLHPKQFEVFQNQSRFRVVAAGRRFGKSVLARSSLIDRAARVPGSLNWYVCPSYRMSKQIMWDALIEAIPRKWIRDTHGTDLRITLVNNSKIELKGADNAESLRGVGLDFVVMDEMQDIVENVWTAVLRPTLMTTKGSALFIGTSKGFNYFHELFQKGMSKEHKNRFWQAWQFRSIDSPWITHAELAAMKEDMDPRTFRQEVMASFEEMAGRVYYPFDKNIHVGEYPFNPNLPILIGQDFNIDPMSSAIFQKQPNGEIWAIGEIVLKQSNVEEVCDEIEKRFYKYQKQVTIYPDPAGNQRQHGRGDTSLDIFRERL